MSTPKHVELSGLERQKLPARKSWLGRLWSDVLYVAKRDKKWWLMPLVVVLLILMALMIFAAAAGPLAPFIYPLL